MIVNTAGGYSLCMPPSIASYTNIDWNDKVDIDISLLAAYNNYIINGPLALNVDELDNLSQFAVMVSDSDLRATCFRQLIVRYAMTVKDYIGASLPNIDLLDEYEAEKAAALSIIVAMTPIVSCIEFYKNLPCGDPRIAKIIDGFIVDHTAPHSRLLIGAAATVAALALAAAARYFLKKTE